MGDKAWDDVGVSCHGKEGWDAKHARVRGVYALSIWVADDDGVVGWAHVGHGGHVDIDSFEECSCSERVFWGGGQATLR